VATILFYVAFVLELILKVLVEGLHAPGKMWGLGSHYFYHDWTI
jgi:hypothetical protein